MRRPILLLLTAAVALVLASAASAAKPIVTFPPFPGFTDTSVCGAAFPVEVSFDGTVRETLYLDQSGVPTRLTQIFGHFVVTFTYGDVSLSTLGPAPTMITFDANGNVETVVIVGLNAAITIPGQGLIALDAGRIVLFDATGKLKPESGFHVFFGTADTTKFCTALGAV